MVRPCTISLVFAFGLPIAAAADDEAVFRNAANQCGAWAVRHVAERLGRPVDASELNQILAPDGSFKNLQQLKSAFATIGLAASGRFFSERSLPRRCCAVLPLRINEEQRHFVACFVDASGGLVIRSDAGPPTPISEVELKRFWDGTALVVSSPRVLALSPASMGWLAGVGLWVCVLIGLCRWGRGYSATLAASLLVLCGCERVQPAATPDIVVLPTTTVDVIGVLTTRGTEAGFLATASFAVHNRSAKDVKINQVYSGCGCGAAHLNPSTIPAGGSATLYVEMFDKAPTPTESTFALIAEGDVETPPVRVRMIPDAKLPYIVDRAIESESRNDVRLAWATFQTIEPLTPNRWLQRARPKSASINSVRLNEKRRKDHSDHRRVDYSLLMDVSVEVYPGDHIAEIELLNDRGDVAQVQPIKLKVVPSLRASPPTVAVLWGRDDEPSVVRRSVEFASLQPVEMTLPLGAPSWLETGWRSNSSNTRRILTLVVHPSRCAGKDAIHLLKIATTSPLHPAVEIPIRVAVIEGKLQ